MSNIGKPSLDESDDKNIEIIQRLDKVSQDDRTNLQTRDESNNKEISWLPTLAPLTGLENLDSRTERGENVEKDNKLTNNNEKQETNKDCLSTSLSTSSSDGESETSSEGKIETDVRPESRTLLASTLPETQNIKEKNDDVTDDSDIEDDLISAINYNTITSLAALKDMLQTSGEDSEGVDCFFHHYFLSHVNRLPSRNQTHSPYPWGRRLSECREEDEYESEEGK